MADSTLNKIVELIRERERRNLLRTVVGAVAVNVIATMIAAIIMDHLRMK